MQHTPALLTMAMSVVIPGMTWCQRGEDWTVDVPHHHEVWLPSPLLLLIKITQQRASARVSQTQNSVVKLQLKEPQMLQSVSGKLHYCCC